MCIGIVVDRMLEVFGLACRQRADLLQRGPQCADKGVVRERELESISRGLNATYLPNFTECIHQ